MEKIWCFAVVVTFGEWRMRVATACLEEASIIREHKVVLRVDTPEERDAAIGILHLNMALQLRAQAIVNKVRFRKEDG